MFIGGCLGFCRLLEVCYCLKNHLDLVPGLQEYCCDIFFYVLTSGLVGSCDSVALCQLDRFLSCPLAVGCTGGILKLACRCFWWYHEQCSLGEGGTSGSVGVVVKMSIYKK